MKRFNKIMAMILSVVMIISLANVGNLNTTETKADTIFAISYPAHKQTVAAGYIDITWGAATAAEVQYYEVYVDNKKVATTTETTYEYYTTLVKLFDVYIKAIFTNGATQITGTTTFGVSKKGLGVSKDMGANLDLKDMNVAWYYNWGDSGPSSGTQYEGIEYVPMVWRATVAGIFKNRVNTLKNKGYKYVLTFNEPDLAGQCDMPVEDVYKVWQGLDGMSGIKISSPVTARWPQISTNWFQPFMNKLNSTDYDPDFISIHCYPDNFAGAGMAEWFVEEVVDWTWETYHKPIWITEFSTTGPNVSATGGNGTKEFWEAVMPLLDARPYVERYAAFGFDNSRTGLWSYSTGELTPAGEVYKAQGNPTSHTAPVWIDNSGNDNSGEEETTTTTTTTTKEIKKPAKAKIKSLKNIKKKKIKLTIKRTKRAVGYQVRWSDSKKFNGYWQKNIKKRTYTIKGLDKNTRYYVKVRAYSMKGKKKLFGKWSARKSVKVRK